MRKVMDIPEQYLRLRERSTPFQVVEVFLPGGGSNHVELYRTAGGVFGRQVAGIVWLHKPENRPDLYVGKTTGCGYDKAQHMLERAFEILGHEMPGPEEMHAAHVGGNYWRF